MAETVPLRAETKELHEEARTLAERWSLPSAEDKPAGTLELVLTPKGLELRGQEQMRPATLRADFLGGRTGFRLHQAASTRQPLLQAIGFKRMPYTVVDATAGLGGDALLMAHAGCTVTALERSAAVAALLDDALARARKAPEPVAFLEQRIELIHADALWYLRELPESDRPEAVYLDPMFPARRKSALVKKEMRLLQQVVGEDPDANQLLFMARRRARQRVVVKRPRHAPPLAESPDRSLSGRSVRFDIYLPAK